ncbi:MAG TPA: TIM-barrel domain-containing protein, partial [Bacteroidota bacterium]
MIRRFLISFFILCSWVFAAPLSAADLTGFTRDGRSLVLSADTMRLRVTFYAPDIVRVDFLPSPATLLDSSFVLVRDTTNAVSPGLLDADSLLLISSSSLTVRCRKSPLRLSFVDAGGRLLLADHPQGGLLANGPARSVAFSVQNDEHYYGTGERGTSVDKRGLAFDSYNTQQGGYSSPLPAMNINVPFVASSKGYALYFENTYRGRFDIGALDPTMFTYTASGGELSYFLIAAPDVPAQLERYTWLTGRQPLPPRWAFGFIQSKYGYHNDAEARSMVQTMRQEQIPCDALVLDLFWFKNMGDIAWNTAAFPDPFGMMRDFLGQGFKTIVITEPYITDRSINYADAVSGGYVARDSSGNPYLLPGWWSCGCNALLLDLTKHDAANWWWSKHPSFFGAELAGLWTDLGEPERHDAGMLHALGPAARVHNIYNLLWAKTIFEGFSSLRPNQRLFNLTRSGYAGIQRYGVIPWSGDVGRSFGGLAVQIPMVQSMGLSGLAYHNSDIGGFTGGQGSPELYVRWMEYGTFCPITRAHGAGRDTEPWTYGTAAEDICRSYISLRYRLLPYIYTLAYQNYATGIPLVRPLFFSDPSMSSGSDSYLWGEAFLVSPVTAAGQTSKTVALPPGTWYNYWTDQPLHGGTTATVPAPLETLPLFVKAGSIVPMQPLMQYTGQRPVDTLFVQSYPPVDGPGSFTLYEDDGTTLAYQSGSFARTAFSSSLTGSGSDRHLDFTCSARTGIYDSMPPTRTYLVTLHAIIGQPGAVTLNGVALSARAFYDSLRAEGSGYWYDPAASMLHVQVPGRVDSTFHIGVQQVRLLGVSGGSPAPERFSLEPN